MSRRDHLYTRIMLWNTKDPADKHLVEVIKDNYSDLDFVRTLLDTRITFRPDHPDKQRLISFIREIDKIRSLRLK